MLPEPPACRQERPVGNCILGVVLAVREPAALEVAADLAGAGIEHLPDRGLGLLFLAQDGAEYHGVDVGLAERDLDHKAPHELLAGLGRR
jgi:hypothetical protein